MIEKLDLTVIILTKDEKLHIRRCVENVIDIAEKVFVVDSLSTDGTQEIARGCGAEVVEHAWPGNQAEQMNWALANLPIATQWVLRIDADEYLSDELKREICEKLPAIGESICGVYMPRDIFFLNKHVRSGSAEKHLLRLFRKGKARSTARKMDEHMTLTEGESTRFDNLFFDHNLKNLTWWTAKHNDYAVREAAEMLDAEYGLSGASETPIEGTALKANRNKGFYMKLPLFVRPFIYFLYRYLIKGGVLDGKEGFLRCFLQGWWYRTLVDAKIYEIKKACGGDAEKIKAYFLTNHNIRF